MFAKVFFLILFVFQIFFSTLPPAFAEEAVKTEKVVVTGVGIDADRALQNAVRNAVEQVVGTYVSSDTIIKNNVLIKDQILAHSGGYVKESKIISTGQSEGLVNINLEAVVVSTTLKRKIEDLNIAIKKVDGGGLFAEAFSKLDSDKSATALIQNNLRKYPQAAYNIDVGKPEIAAINHGDNTVDVKVRVAIKWDKDYLSEVKDVLSQVATKKIDNFHFDGKDASYYKLFNSSTSTPVCFTQLNFLKTAYASRCFMVPNNLIDGVKSFLHQKQNYSKGLISRDDMSLTVLLNDSNGTAVEMYKHKFEMKDSYNYLADKTKLAPDFYPSEYSFTPPNTVIGIFTPVFVVEDGTSEHDVVMNINADNLKTITEIKVTLDEFEQ